MARPTIFDRSLTAAERARRYRERKKRGPQEKDPLISALQKQAGSSECAKLAAIGIRKSPRFVYYERQIRQHGAFDWGAEGVMDGRYGRVGVRFIAEVCMRGDEGVQRLIYNTIKDKGPKEARLLWRALKSANAHLYLEEVRQAEQQQRALRRARQAVKARLRTGVGR